MPGTTVLVPTSLSSRSWVCGGPVALIGALEEAVRPFGVLVMPTHSGDVSDPSGWQNPPVPARWREEILRSMPPYDPEFTPTRGMGVLPELFRTQATVLRSTHPHLSSAAWGTEALSVVADHSLECGLGEGSPLARIYDRDGWVLLLGVGYDKNTSFHLGESRIRFERVRRVLRADSRRWPYAPEGVSRTRLRFRGFLRNRP